MSQFSPRPTDDQDSPYETSETHFVQHPHRHERRPAQRQARSRRKHTAARHERHELLVSGTHMTGTNVPSAPLAQELEAKHSRISPALERRRMRRERHRRKVRRTVLRLATLAAVLFIGQSVVAALTAPQFKIARLDVTGVQETNAKLVDDQAAPLQGQNVFRANIRGIKKNIEALPTVKSVSIAREMSWPPSARLVVTERKPVLRVGAGNDWWAVDEDGVAYRKATQADESLYALTAPQLQPETGKALPAKWWIKAVALAQAIQSDNQLVGKRGSLQLASTGMPDDSVETSAQFWSLRRLYLDKDGLASVRISSNGPLKSYGEMLIRLGDDDWAPKLARAREAMQYFGRIGRRAEELNMTSLEYPLWKQKPVQENETKRTESTT